MLPTGPVIFGDRCGEALDMPRGHHGRHKSQINRQIGRSIIGWLRLQRQTPTNSVAAATAMLTFVVHAQHTSTRWHRQQHNGRNNLNQG